MDRHGLDPTGPCRIAGRGLARALAECFGPGANEWQHTVWQRCVNAGLVADVPSA
ncbi:hypothetical protein [Streptomyces sp. NPDC059010]|uniref:hypothetical protein n=1 Tax=Streptomyces sp. NPDC059010 TaxID=3346695 RepID=UPI0036B95DF2